MSSTIAAIDTGSNAIRAVIARTRGETYEVLFAERAPVRLGRGAFTTGALETATIDEAVAVFREFKQQFDAAGVSAYRAVATSAVRDAENRDVLIHRLYHEANIELEVIDGEEEARLIRKAVVSSFPTGQAPACILDLGGGSLEINTRTGAAWRGRSLPIGTVRLLELFGISNAITDAEASMVRRYVNSVTTAAKSGGQFATAAICGGNAEALAKIVGAQPQRGTASKLANSSLIEFELAALERKLPEIVSARVDERMERYSVRQDRAEVLGVAAIVFATLGRQLGVSHFVVPSVGVRDAILLELLESTRSQLARAESAADKAILTAARGFAHRVDHDITHGEQVRWLARCLFEQLGDIHQLPQQYCMWLELAAMLHDIGEVVSPRGHHKHSEYMIKWGRLPGLSEQAREVIALAVRCHRKSAAECKKHIAESPLPKELRTTTRRIASLLRLADSLDSDHRKRVVDLAATRMGNEVILDLTVRDGPSKTDDQLLRKADLFREEFGLNVRSVVASAASASFGRMATVL